MSAKSNMLLSGDKALRRKLEALGERVYNRVVKAATAKAMIPVSQAAKRNAPKEFGILRKSIGRRTKAYKKSGTVVTTVGPRLGYSQTVVRDGKSEKRVPMFYAHLVEFGFNRVAPGSLKEERSKRGDRKIRAKGTGTVTGHVAAQPFMRPAMDSNKATVLSSYRQQLAAGIEKEAQKEAKK